MVIADIMTTNPESATADSTVAEAMATLYNLDVRHLPIVDGGELVGIVSDRDLRSFTQEDMFDLDRQAELRAKLKTPVSEIMSTDVASVDPEGEVTEVIDMMLEERVGAVTVVDGRTRALVGIVSYIDVLRALRSKA